MRILLVDDHADIRLLLSLQLRQCGASVKTAASAEQALVALAQEPVDVLISDLAMPQKDGFELIRSIRSLNSGINPDVPAIALTGHDTPENRTLALTCGFQAFVSKPADAEDLVRAIAPLLGLAA